MTANRIRRTALPLGIVGAVAAIAIASGSFSGAVVAKPSPDKSLAAAQVALGKGQIDKAITLAETAVAGNPREPSYRALLGQAYLRAGRFDSAVTTLDDAMKLGDNTGKTALALSLANIAAGDARAAVAQLSLKAQVCIDQRAASAAASASGTVASSSASASGTGASASLATSRSGASASLATSGTAGTPPASIASPSLATPTQPSATMTSTEDCE